MIVQLAALLHDVDDIKLSPETCADKDRAVAFLREHSVSEAMIKPFVVLFVKYPLEEQIQGEYGSEGTIYRRV